MKTNVMQKSILIACTIFLVFLSLATASSATFNNTSTTGDIQNFINNKATDKELILDGEFNNLSTLQINRSLKISGMNMQK